MKPELPTVHTDLIVRCQRGDEQAFNDLYNLYGQMVWRLCARMTISVTDAEDMAQEVWIQVWKQIGTYRCESAFSTWLYKVTTNICLQQLRKQKRELVCSIDDMDQITTTCGNPVECINKESVDSEITKLPELLRLPLILRVYENLSYAEIADILDCTTAAVKMRISRARMALAKTLEVNIK
ncbi:RNA polymerase sigma factor [bacterium]|nr:RNA polymerase sigma factor [bacterium]